MPEIDEAACDLLFREARSHDRWRPEPLPESLLRRLWELARWGPTSANGCPLRILFVTSERHKERLAEVALGSNQEKIRSAPATAILAHDLEFWRELPRLFPQKPGMRALYEGDRELAAETAFRNGTLQGAYFILAARALGLDCGPMSGFDNAAVDRLFFPQGRVRSNFLCSLGYGDPSVLGERLPRPAFDEVCRLL